MILKKNVHLPIMPPLNKIVICFKVQKNDFYNISLIDMMKTIITYKPSMSSLCGQGNAIPARLLHNLHFELGT